MAIQRINIIVAGKKYPVKVEDEEIDAIREIEKNINRKINEYSMLYGNISKLDIITLILLDCSLDLLNKKKGIGQEERLINTISDIEKSVDKVL